ncbi:MAG TPA: response regulator [Sphingobacteriaceae bacterium]|nr:response regulator [Sphingobacteriaceae bacterium]
MAKTILIGDDDIDILFIIKYILSEEGYIVQTYSGAKALVNDINKIKPDLILLDVMFGDADGRDICKTIKNADQQMPVILISASHDLEQTLFQPGGPDDFIAKPFDVDCLIKKVHLALAA